MATALLHGGGLARAIAHYGGDREGWLDLSTGINPRPWPVPALACGTWNRLPEIEQQEELEGTARQFYGVANAQAVVAVPGTQALIELLPRLLPGRSAAILTTRNGVYGEHGFCLDKNGWRTRLIEKTGDVQSEDVAVLVHPNNPDGHLWDRTCVRELAARLEQRGGYVIVDEAFCDTNPELSLATDAPANMIVLKSCGKFFGLAGLRLGFAVCAPAIADKIRTCLGPWAVSGPAIEIGKQAMNDHMWVDRSRSWLDAQSSAVARVLEEAGLRISGRHALFVLCETDNALQIAERLARLHILVRHFPDRPHLLRFGLPADDAKLERLAVALASW